MELQLGSCRRSMDGRSFLLAKYQEHGSHLPQPAHLRRTPDKEVTWAGVIAVPKGNGRVSVSFTLAFFPLLLLLFPGVERLWSSHDEVLH